MMLLYVVFYTIFRYFPIPPPQNRKTHPCQEKARTKASRVPAHSAMNVASCGRCHGPQRSPALSSPALTDTSEWGQPRAQGTLLRQGREQHTKRGCTFFPVYYAECILL